MYYVLRCQVVKETDSTTIHSTDGNHIERIGIMQGSSKP